MLAALGCLLLLAQTDPAAPVAEKPTLLVMPLRAEPKLAVSARALDELILEAVDGLRRYSVLGPADVNALLGLEKMKDAIACEDTVCAAEVGGALGAPYLLAGELRALGDQVVLSLRLMDTKKRVVMSRATARGATSAESLNQMMAHAVGTCFGTTVQAGGTQMAPTATADDGGYIALITELGGYLSRNEYTSLFAHLDELEARAKKAKAPANASSAEEVVTYHRALACFTLKRAECLETAAARYRKQWPTGTYGAGIKTFVTTMEDQKAAQRDRAAEVAGRIAEIREKERAGTYDRLLAEQLVALAFYGGQDYANASKQFALLLELLYAEKPPQTDKIMSTTSQAVFAWQQAGDLAAARAALQRAEALDAKAYRGANLHQTERGLPK